MNNSPWKKRLAYALAGLALLGGLALAFRSQPVPVELAEVTRGPFEQTVDEDGKTRVRERYVVSAPLAGKLQRIALKAGDSVEDGMVVAYIDPSLPTLLDARTERELRERLGAAEAAKQRSAVAIERAAAALEKSRADLARAQQLAEKNFISPAQREQAELAAKFDQRELEAARYADLAAQHDVATARAALSRLRQEAAGTKPSGQRWEVRSPLSGAVLKVVQESETAVAGGAPLMEIGAPSQLEIVVDVLSTDAVQIAPGALVHVERWGKAEALEARVRRIEPAAFTKVSALGVEEQRVNVIADFTSPSEKWQSLGDGYKIDARIVTARREDAIKVPVGALFRDGEQWAVFTVANGKAVKQVVQLSLRGGREAVVDQGIASGEKVIVHPGDAVQDGAKIKVR
jgi:HlyD family secretion protein